MFCTSIYFISVSRRVMCCEVKILQVINNANGVESISPIKNIYFFTSLSMYYFTVITQLEIQS